MAVTKSFKELVQRRVAKDPDFATALLREGVETMLTGDVDGVVDDDAVRIKTGRRLRHRPALHHPHRGPLDHQALPLACKAASCAWAWRAR